MDRTVYKVWCYVVVWEHSLVHLTLMYLFKSLVNKFGECKSEFYIQCAFIPHINGTILKKCISLTYYLVSLISQH
jgi:hypothetical protein